MTQRWRPVLILIAMLAWPCGADAQDDMSFSLDDTVAPAAEPAADGGDLSFDVIDTDKTVAEVEAERKSEQDLIRVIQRRPFLRKGRVELSPMLGSNVNDPLISAFLATGNLNYHLTEVLSFGLNGGYSLGSETDLFDKVIADYELFPEVSQVLWFAGVQFEYAAIYGKFALFNSWIVPWDTYALLGAGWTRTELAGHPTIAVGVGQRYFMNRWFTLNFELRNATYNEDYPGGSELVNNLVFTAGVGFFVPPSFEYRTLK